MTTDGAPDYQYGSGPDSTSNATLLRKFGLPHLPPQWPGHPTRRKCWRIGPTSAASGKPTWWRPDPPTAAPPAYAASGTPTPGTTTCRRPSWSSSMSPRALWSKPRPSRCSCHRCRRVMSNWAWWAEDSSAVYYLKPAPGPAHPHLAPAGPDHRRGQHRAPRNRHHPGGAQPVDERPADRAGAGRRGAVVLAAGRLGPPLPVRPAHRRVARAGHLRAVGGATDPARRRRRAGGVLPCLRAGRRRPVPAHGVPGRP